MNDRHLQQDFEGQKFIIDNIERECYYCTLEDGGAWIWLHPKKGIDDCNRINFIVWDEYYLEQLRNQVLNNENIIASDYGYLSKQE